MHKLSFNTILATVLFVLFLGVLFLSAHGLSLRSVEDASKAQDTLRSVRVGIFPESPNAHYPLFVAKSQGFFADEGLAVDFVSVSPGASVPALLAGEIDYGPFPREVVAAALKDAPVKVIALYPEEPLFVAVSRPGIEIAEIRSIASDYPNSAPHYHALAFIERHDLEADVIGQDGRSLLVSDRVDAAVPDLAAGYELAEEGLEVLEVIPSDIVSGITTTDTRIADHPKEVTGVIRARERAYEFMRQEPEIAVDLMLEMLGETDSEKQRAIAENIHRTLMTRPQSPGSVASGMDLMIKMALTGTFETLDDINAHPVSEADRRAAFDLSLMPVHNSNE